MKFYCCFVFCGCFFGIVRSETPSCTTPNGENGLCKPLRSCPILRKAFDSEEEIVQKFVDASTLSCGGGSLIVCCGTHGNYTKDVNKEEMKDILEETKPTTESNRDYALKNLLPNTKYCGMQHVDDYVYNESRTSIDEFPWLLLVYYDEKKVQKRSADPEPIDVALLQSLLRPPKVTYKCTGVLINNRYALTSSSCASATSMRVTLGQYEENKNVSCIPTPYYVDDCTEPAINVTVTEQIRSPNGRFLLLRLERKISYTDFIRPICLPTDESIRPKLKDTIITSGWGSYRTGTEINVGIKKRIKQNIISKENCKNNNSTSDHICCSMGQNESNYICKVDRGGPIMYRHGTKNWYVEGIIDVDECVNENVSGDRITPELVDWILENLKP